MRVYRQFLLSLVLTLAAEYVWAQRPDTYTVIKVNGRVISALFKRQIKAGDVVNTSDKLIFESRDSYMHVVNPEGRKTIRYVPDNSPHELMQLLQTFLSPDKKNRASRGGTSLGLGPIIQQLSYDTMLILDKGRVIIDTLEVSMKKPAGIKATYSSKTEKVARIISDGKGFNLGKNYLFDDTMNKPYPRIMVSYYENTMDPDFFTPSELLGYFVPLYVDEDALRNEVKTLIDTLKAYGLSSSQIITETISYLASEYASPIPQNVKDWLSANKLINP